MSVQLILYPQSYDGQHNVYASGIASLNEFVVDGINFVTIPVANTYQATSSWNTISVITTTPPAIINTWYKARSQTGTSSYPARLANQLKFNNVGSSENTMVYQKISGLTVGSNYTLTVDITTPSTTGIFAYYWINPITNTVSVGGTVAAAATQISDVLPNVPNSQMILALVFASATDTATVGNISVVPQGTTPTTITTELSDGQVICDLYENEDIPLTLSVDDFKNVAEQVQSYSKAFNLPATKRNNQIFDSIFEVTRADNGLNFNPYVKTQCSLKQDGFILFEGYLRLIDIQDKEGEISYNVNLYSEVIALADVLQDRKFSDLDFTELEHNYNVTQVQYSWDDSGTGMTYNNPSTSGFRNAYTTLRYPFVDWNHQYTVDANGVILPNLESTFRPFINIKYLIDRIFNQPYFPFTYTSEFFDTADFNKLYMDFNWGVDNAPVIFNNSGQLTNTTPLAVNIGTMAVLDFDEYSALTGNELDESFGYSGGTFTAQENGQIYAFSYNMDFDRTLSGSLYVEWIVNGVAVNSDSSSSTSLHYQGSFTTPPLSAGDTVFCQAYTSVSGWDLEQAGGTTPNFTPLIQIVTSVNQMTDNVFLGALRGELGQWDFLKGIMTMFNLISIPDKDNLNNILIEPYSDVFINNTASGTTSDLSLASRGIAHDWTEKIDISEMKLTPLTELNKKTIFKFVEDDDDYAFNVYKNSVQGHLYGSKVYDATAYTILGGVKEVVADPFAATIVKPLMSQYPDLVTPSIYSYNADDGVSEGFENSPRIMYNNGIKTTGVDCYVAAQNGSSAIYLSNFLQFSHLTNVPTTLTTTNDFHFGQCQLMPSVGASVPDNLYNLYWAAYYDDLYHPDTRTMSLKVNLSPSDINVFKFYDTVLIKNREFRVNKIDYKPNDLATVEFILIP